MNPDKTRGRSLFWVGILLCPLAIALVFVQSALDYQATPWYLPALTTLGALLLLASLVQRWSIPRIAVLVLVAAFAGLQWFFIGWLAKLPEYQGPTQGEPIPVFTASLADGRSFTDSDLQDGRKRVLVFFRGRW
jgi:hypothetical protein